MSLFDKLKLHIEATAHAKNPKFTLLQTLSIIARRNIIPESILHTLFLHNITNIGSEQHLENYMIPKHNGCFIDIGANIGLWTFFMAKKGIKVHAFEPTPRIYKILKKNNKYPHVTTYPYALGEFTGTANLNLHHISGHNSLLTKSPDFNGQQTETIVRPLDDLNIHNIGLIKIDTEGYEVPILFGAKNTINKEKPRLIIEVHKPFKEQENKIKNILSKYKYKWIKRSKIKLTGTINPQFHIIADPKEKTKK